MVGTNWANHASGFTRACRGAAEAGSACQCGRNKGKGGKARIDRLIKEQGGVAPAASRDSYQPNERGRVRQRPARFLQPAITAC